MTGVWVIKKLTYRNKISRDIRCFQRLGYPELFKAKGMQHKKEIAAKTSKFDSAYRFHSVHSWTVFHLAAECSGGGRDCFHCVGTAIVERSKLAIGRWLAWRRERPEWRKRRRFPGRGRKEGKWNRRGRGNITSRQGGVSW